MEKSKNNDLVIHGRISNVQITPATYLLIPLRLLVLIFIPNAVEQIFELTRNANVHFILRAGLQKDEFYRE